MRFNPDAKLDPSQIDDRRGQPNPLVTPTARPPSAMSIVADVQRRMNTGLRRWSPGILGGRTDVASPVSPPSKSVLVPRVLANPPTGGGAGGQYSATLTVAAANALPSSIAIADYQCDGTNDEEEIVDAIAICTARGVAGDGGGRVLLTEGDFHISEAGIFQLGTFGKWTTLQGQGVRATRLYHHAAVTNTFVLATFFADGFTLCDMTINAQDVPDGGYGVGLDGEYTSVMRVIFESVGTQGEATLNIQGEHARISDCEILTPPATGSGIKVRGDWPIIVNNHMRETPGFGIDLDGLNSIVMGNIIFGSNTGGGSTDGIVAGADSIVVGNMIYDWLSPPATINAGAGSQVANNVLG